MTERCFYESEGEKTLNAYQYEMEIQQIREQHDFTWLNNAQAQASAQAPVNE
jgi:hypothetical protein